MFKILIKKFADYIVSKIVSKIEQSDIFTHKNHFYLSDKKIKNLTMNIKKEYDPLVESLWNLIRRLESNNRALNSLEMNNPRFDNHASVSICLEALK